MKKFYNQDAKKMAILSSKKYWATNVSKFLCFDNRGPEELEAINDELEPIRYVSEIWN